MENKKCAQMPCNEGAEYRFFFNDGREEIWYCEKHKKEHENDKGIREIVKINWED